MNTIKLVLVAIIGLVQGTAAACDDQFGHLNNWTYSQPLSSDTQFEQVWNAEVGHGRSQVIVDGDRVFVMAGEHESRKGKSKLIHTRLLCIDLKSGDELWKHESDSVDMYKEQESFSGAPISPQATPTLIGESIVTISFTGLLECVDAATGDLRWKQDLVKDLKAEPVQFGFSASPVVSKDNRKLYVMAAGPSGGLYCLSLKDGSTIWKAACESASYATPTYATFNDVEQLILITKDNVLGIAADNGQPLWAHDLAEKGLTNVPSPIALPTGFIISGQGCKGTRRIDVTKTDGRWKTEERWYAKRIQLFYSNWLLANPNIVVGCNDKLMFAFDVESGSTLGRWRGFSDGNVLQVGDSLIVVDGKGNLSLLSPQLANDESDPRFTQHQKLPLLKQRCWTPPTLVENGLLLRGGNQLTMVRFVKNSTQPLPNKLKKPKTLSLKRIAAASPAAPPKESVDHVLAIFETYEEKGPKAALRQYSKLRSQTPCPLVAEDRVALINAAKQNRLNDLAKMILAHALEDFPDSKEIRKLAKESK